MNATPAPPTMHRLRSLTRRLALVALLALASPAAMAWWNEAWTQRTVFTLDTGPQGVPLAEAVGEVAVPLRLHSGNFDFVNAREDGADLRVLAADDKTPLPFRVERFDPVNELALLWVKLPGVQPGSAANKVHVYAGRKDAAAEGRGPVHDAATRAAISFDDRENRGADQAGRWRSDATLVPEANALLAGGVRLVGSAVAWPEAEAPRLDAGGAATVSLWLKPDGADAATVLAWGPLTLAQAGGRLSARIGGTELAGGELKVAAWNHVVLVLGAGQARLYLGGAEVAQAAVATPAVAGPLRLGEGLRGVVDELQLSAAARTPAWVALAAAAQGNEGRLVRSAREDQGAGGDGGHGGYLGILVANLTLDAWVVIVILAGMFLLAAWVMAVKLVYVGRADRANRAFLGAFREADTAGLLRLDPRAHAQSTLFRLYHAGVRELDKRGVGQPAAAPLSGASLDAVKASVDADLVRESHKLNAQMVWLTIAISGGPFLGLLGTVVGVMITFAAIAAAGDVNVNAIAPGIAAALLATVAGLAVAIPALFGYNYLASRIKNVSADMQIFVDEFITRVAEQYGAR